MHRFTSPAATALLASLVMASGSFVAPALAQWQPGGIPVCASCEGTTEDLFRAIPDGEGGVYVAWRRDQIGGADLYLQRLTRDGVRAPGWPSGGVPLVTAPELQGIEDLVLDGSGGVFALWVDHRDGLTGRHDAYVGHILGNGTLAPGWPVNGRMVSDDPGSRSGRVRGCSDGQGGVFVAWIDYRNGSESANTNPDVFAVHLLANGDLAPGWAIGGNPVAADSLSNELLATVVSDDSGGFYVVWLTASSGLSNGRVQRILGDGSRAEGWPSAGMSVTDHGRSDLQDACGDGSGGLLVAWPDYRTYGGFPPLVEWMDIYAAYLRFDGSFAPGWGVNGLPIAVKPGRQINVKVAQDGQGHLLVTWNDQGESRASRVLRDGSIAPGWPLDGALVTTRAGVEFQSSTCADGAGGAFVVTESWESTQLVIAQRFTATGSIAYGWSPEGVAMGSYPVFQGDPVVVPSPPASAIVVWSHSSGQSDIYAQRLVLDGVVATKLSLVSAEATAEGVRVTGHSPGPAGERVTLERQRTDTPWQTIASLTVPASGRIEFVDREVSPGERLGYRLGRGASDALEYSSEVWVEVPLKASFALAGFRPNPSPTRPTVEFSVATSEPTRLEVFDTAGRRRHALEIESPAPGRQMFALPVVLDPGLYWLRLTQGSRATRRSAVVVR